MLTARREERVDHQSRNRRAQTKGRAVHGFRDAHGENGRLVRRVHLTDGREALDETSHRAEQTPERGGVAEHGEIAGALLDDRDFAEAGLVHGGLDFHFALGDVEEAGLQDVDQGRGLLVREEADGARQVTLEQVAAERARVAEEEARVFAKLKELSGGKDDEEQGE